MSSEIEKKSGYMDFDFIILTLEVAWELPYLSKDHNSSSCEARVSVIGCVVVFCFVNKIFETNSCVRICEPLDMLSFQKYSYLSGVQLASFYFLAP